MDPKEDNVEVPDMSQYVASAGGSNGEAPTGTQQVIAKMLVSNATAGSIIGKSGSNIEQLQRTSGARIQLSRTGELYPGTSDRVLLLSGTLHAVLTAVFLILEKISRDLSKSPVTDGAAPRALKGTRGEVEDSQVKLALSRHLCGLLNGHKGQTDSQVKLALSMRLCGPLTGLKGQTDSQVKLALSSRLCGLLNGHEGQTDSQVNLALSGRLCGPLIGHKGQTDSQVKLALSRRLCGPLISHKGQTDSQVKLALSRRLCGLLNSHKGQTDSQVKLALSRRLCGPLIGHEGQTDSQVKLALSRRLCGLLIGHKGQTVQDFITDSGANIRVQSLSELTPSDPERTITIAGARDQVLRAVALVLNTLSLHEGYAPYMDSTLQLASSQGVVLPPRSMNTKSALSNYRATFTLFLPDEEVGAVLGKKGQNLIDIQQSARVTVKISDRSKMDPDTNEREVTIAGNYSAVKLAEAMIGEKLQQNKARNAREEEHSH
eukprot:gene5394-5616_t